MVEDNPFSFGIIFFVQNFNTQIITTIRVYQSGSNDIVMY